jgi:nicotinamide riboside kinase
MRIVFIEGVSGVGKSTLTENLTEELRGIGFVTERYLEFDFNNPIDFYCTAYIRQEEYAALLTDFPAYAGEIIANSIPVEYGVKLVRYFNRTKPLFSEPLLSILCKREFNFCPSAPVGLNEHTRVFKTVWERFSNDSVNSSLDYLLFDGSLIYHPVNDLIRSYNVAPSQAVKHINTLTTTLAASDARVVYLFSNDIADRLVKARASRGEKPPTEEQIRFWKARRRMDDSILRQLSLPWDAYDVSSEGWEEITKKVVKRITTGVSG